jgi:hypothetical protein
VGCSPPYASHQPLNAILYNSIQFEMIDQSDHATYANHSSSPRGLQFCYMSAHALEYIGTCFFRSRCEVQSQQQVTSCVQLKCKIIIVTRSRHNPPARAARQTTPHLTAPMRHPTHSDRAAALQLPCTYNNAGRKRSGTTGSSSTISCTCVRVGCPVGPSIQRPPMAMPGCNAILWCSLRGLSDWHIFLPTATSVTRSVGP